MFLSSLSDFSHICSQEFLHVCHAPIVKGRRTLRTLDLGGKASGSRVTLGGYWDPSQWPSRNDEDGEWKFVQERKTVSHAGELHLCSGQVD